MMLAFGLSWKSLYIIGFFGFSKIFQMINVLMAFY